MMENTKPVKDVVQGFTYHESPWRFVANYRDGAWQTGELTSDANVTLNESACVLQYAQTVFEGLKAYRTGKGKIVCFRPDLNAARLQDSCERMMIPPLPAGMFEEAVRALVRANAEWVPSYESGGSLYIRPCIFGTNPVIGVKPASEFQFRVFVTPVGSYFSGGMRALKLRVSDFDRAAPHGTGHIKAGLNYAMSLYAIADAHRMGYDENLYLDSATRTYVEETGGANILFVSANGTIVTPRSDTILPSITRRSLLYVAQQILGIAAEQRPIAVAELPGFSECALCGTAAVLSPVGSIDDHGKIYHYEVPGEQSLITKLYKTLIAIQHEDIPAPQGWIFPIT